MLRISWDSLNQPLYHAQANAKPAGCELLAVEEFGTGSDGAWETAPVRQLPRVLLVVGGKRLPL